MTIDEKLDLILARLAELEVKLAVALRNTYPVGPFAQERVGMHHGPGMQP